VSLLEVDQLGVHYKTRKGFVRAVDGVSFRVAEGENFGIVGESGCGKSTLAKAITRIFPKNAFIPYGKILFKEKDLARIGEGELRKIRWREISMISQSAMNTLDPVYRVGSQIIEAITQHEKVSRREAWDRAATLFQTVGLDVEHLKDYPHQLSGGMRQRAIIAMALVLQPSLIIADEPTTALDVITQDQILTEFKEKRDKFATSMIFITHDISVLAEICDKIAVMYAGRFMEYGTLRDVIKTPFHPYTIGLQTSFLSIDVYHEKLISIPGFPPDLIHPPEGCLFRERCPFAERACHEEPGLIEVCPGHYSACHFPGRVEEFRQRATLDETWVEKSAA
jgi:oligopeptide/dipeptide ABC transporter ATP-binding protein